MMNAVPSRWASQLQESHNSVYSVSHHVRHRAVWWEGDHITGTQGWAEEIQRLANHEVRRITGCFWTTNLEALSMESGLRTVTV